MSKPSDKKRAKQRARQRRKRRPTWRVPKLTRTQRVAKKIDDTWSTACDKAEGDGFDAETVHCMRETGLMLTQQAIDSGEVGAEEVAHWVRSLAQYRAAHPEEQIVDESGRRLIAGTEEPQDMA